MLQSSLLELSGVYHIKERIFTKLLKTNGLEHMSPAQTRILMALWVKDNVPVRRLSEITSLDKSTLSLSLTRMEQNGLLMRSGDPLDRRVVRVRLTDKGLSIKTHCANAMGELTNILYHDIEPEKLEVFLDVLRQVLQNVSSLEQSQENGQG